MADELPLPLEIPWRLASTTRRSPAGDRTRRRSRSSSTCPTTSSSRPPPRRAARLPEVRRRSRRRRFPSRASRRCSSARACRASTCSSISACGTRPATSARSGRTSTQPSRSTGDDPDGRRRRRALRGRVRRPVHGQERQPDVRDAEHAVEDPLGRRRRVVQASAVLDRRLGARTSTDVTSDRAVSQVSDTTTREASEERAASSSAT